MIFYPLQQKSRQVFALSKSQSKIDLIEEMKGQRWCQDRCGRLWDNSKQTYLNLIAVKQIIWEETHVGNEGDPFPSLRFPFYWIRDETGR